MDSRGVLRSAPLGGRSASPFKSKMSAKLQEEPSQGRSTAPKLPHFPAKKGAATAVASSPAKASRDAHLPGMPASGRAHPDKGGRREASGADKLAQLSRQAPGVGSSGKGSGAGVDDALGFDSPRRGSARAQVARDGVLAYMRRQKAEPRDTSFDDDDRAPPASGRAPTPTPGAAQSGTNSGTTTTTTSSSGSGQLGLVAGRNDDGSLSFSLDFMEAYRTRPSTAAAAATELGATADTGDSVGTWAGAGAGVGADADGAGVAHGRQQQQQQRGPRGSESFDAEELLRRYSLGRGRLGGGSQGGLREEEAEEEDDIEEDIADDTAGAAGPDQSPTRHTPSGVHTAGAGAARSRAPAAVDRPGRPASAAPATAHDAAARASLSRSRAAPVSAGTGGGGGGGSGAGVMRMSLSIAAAVASPLASSVALTDDAFELFKRDIAARVIQVHWRRWQAWKAKVRRDAEQRILQQLFADDPSGLSLKLLLGGVGGGDAGSGSDGASRSGGAASAHHAGEPAATATRSAGHGAREDESGLPLPSRHASVDRHAVAVPASPISSAAAGGALEKQPSSTRLPALKRPTSAGATTPAPAASGVSSVDAMGNLPAAAAAGPGSGSNTPHKSAAAASLASLRANGKGDTSAAAGGRAGTPSKRPVSAADAYAQARAESILADADRGRRRPATAGAALVESPGRVRGVATSVFEDSLDVEDTEWQEAMEYDEDEDNPHAVRATPRKAHKGGHAVYTFVATPRRRAAAEAAAAAAAAEADAPAQPQTAPGNNTSTCSRAEEPIATEPAANRGAADMRASRDMSRAKSGAAPALQPQQQHSGQQLEQRPSGQQENLQLREPSLDADTNPAMASPALSAITGEAGGAVAGAAGLPAGTGAGPMSWTEDDAQSRPSGGRQHQEADDANQKQAGASSLAPQAEAVLAGQQQQGQQGGSGRRMEALQRLRQQGSQRGFGLSSTGALLPSSTSASASAVAPDATGDSPLSSRDCRENASRKAPPPEHSHHSHHGQQGGSDEARSHRAAHGNRQHRDVGTSGQHHQGRHAEREENGGSRDGLEASLRTMGERNRRATAGAGGREEQDALDRHERSEQQSSRHAERRPLSSQQQQPHAPHPPAERQHAEPHHRERQQQQHHHHHHDSVAVDGSHRRHMSAAATLGAGHDHSAHDRGRTAGEGGGNELAGPSGRGHPRPASAFAAAPPAQPREQEQQQSARAQQLRQSRHPGRRVSSDSESDGSEEDEEALEEPITGRHAQEPSRRRPEAAAAPGHQQTGDMWAERRGGAWDEAGRHDNRPAPRQVHPDAPAAAAAASRSQPAASSGRPSSSGVEWDHPQALQTRAQQQLAMQPQQEGAASKATAGGVHKQQQQQQQPQAEVAASLTAEKMTSILKYLDEVELQAEQEAACAAVAPALLLAEPSTAAALAAMAAVPGSGSRPATAAAASMRSRGASAGPARPSTAHTAGGAQIMTQRSLAALSEAGGRSRQPRAHGRSQSRPRGLASSRRSGFDQDQGYDDDGRRATEDCNDFDDQGYDDDGDLRDGDAASVGAASGMSGLTTGRPAFLAESVYESVRAKIRRLQEDVSERDDRIAELGQEVEALTAAQRSMAMEAEARLNELLAVQRAEYEGAVARHLAFVDRLLVDKEALTARAEQLEAAVKGADDKQERAIAKLKEGWAAELRRQKEGWAAAEKQRREAWMAAKATEIKDMTVKGLEGEVQKLLSRHKAELSAAQQAAADEARRHLDVYVAQNEAAVRQLKERMAREAEEAVEKERISAGVRLREVSERYEQQLQTQRMRLVSDADLRLEHLEQARKEDKKRYEEALSSAREAAEARQRDMEEDWRREKEALRKAHDKQIESLREQYETGQEGWRAAMAERARKEVAERVAAIREKLLEERNSEIQAVMTRLEEEHAAAVESLKEDFRRREEAAAAKATAALKEAKRAETKMAERFRCAGAAAQTAEERVAAAELAASELRRELEQRNSTIRWLEGQVSVAKEEAAARERDLRSLGADKAAVAAEAAAAANRERQAVEARLAATHQEMSEMRNKHGAEMAHVEARVKATLARKDDVIAGLREQLATLAAELRGTQEVLRLQQEELGR